MPASRVSGACMDAWRPRIPGWRRGLPYSPNAALRCEGCPAGWGGAGGRARTDTPERNGFLRPARLPIPPRPRTGRGTPTPRRRSSPGQPASVPRRRRPAPACRSSRLRSGSVTGCPFPGPVPAASGRRSRCPTRNAGGRAGSWRERPARPAGSGCVPTARRRRTRGTTRRPRPGTA